ncbi:MAG: Uma2 family endonuclease [Verrucomicrobiota bacterium]
MPNTYEEVLDGEACLRLAPAEPHELLCNRLHAWVRAALPPNSSLSLPPRRTPVELPGGDRVCPDLTLTHTADGRLYLAVEVLQPGDHHRDTVVKKDLYLAHSLPRLWLVDSRYHNVEVYGTGQFGFRLESILAHADALTDPALPGFTRTMADLFARPCP